MSEQVTLTITMSDTQWAEVANSLESKARLVKRGDYGEGENAGDNEKWVIDLKAALNVISTEMEKKGVSW